MRSRKFRVAASIAFGVAVSAALTGWAPAATIAYWPFDSSTGSPGLADSVGSHDFTVTGSFNSSANAAAAPVPNPDATVGFTGDPSANPDGGIAYASLLSHGASGQDRLTAANDTGNIFNLSGRSFTFEGWFQHDTGSAPEGFGDMIGGTRIASPWGGYILKMNSDSAISAYFSGGMSFSVAQTSATDYRDGAFHHFALVWQDGAGDNSTGLVALYLDGALEANSSAPAGFSAAAADGGDSTFAVAGRTVDGNNWDGRFDEFRFSNVALSPAEFLYANTGPDTNAPALSTLSPTNGATRVSPRANLVATLNETIRTNATGSIVISNLTDSTGTTLAIGDTSQVTVSGKTLTINPTDDLEYGTSYAVLIDANALVDAATNFFAGITDTTTWTFDTAELNVMTGSGLWTNGGKWTLGHMPTGGETAVIDTHVVVGFTTGHDAYTGDLIMRAGSKIDTYQNGYVSDYFPDGPSSEVHLHEGVLIELRQGTMDEPITLHGNTTIQKMGQGARLYVNGPLSGSGHLTYQNYYWGGRELRANNPSPNTYTGGTTMERHPEFLIGGRLQVYANNAFGTGDVTINGTGAGFMLQLLGSTTDVIDDAAVLYMVGDGAVFDLQNDSETVRKLFIDGESQLAGTWGSSSSPAENQDDTHFAGTGVLTVLGTDIPPAGAVMIIR